VAFSCEWRFKFKCPNLVVPEIRTVYPTAAALVSEVRTVYPTAAALVSEVRTVYPTAAALVQLSLRSCEPSANPIQSYCPSVLLFSFVAKSRYYGL